MNTHNMKDNEKTHYQFFNDKYRQFVQENEEYNKENLNHIDFGMKTQRLTKKHDELHVYGNQRQIS